LYCLENNIKGVLGKFPDYIKRKNLKLKDCKCYNSFEVWEGQEYISGADNLLNNRKFIKFLSRKFNKKSNFEK
jgi:hypothetical protein